MDVKHAVISNFNFAFNPQCGKIQYTVEKNGVKKPW